MVAITVAGMGSTKNTGEVKKSTFVVKAPKFNLVSKFAHDRNHKAHINSHKVNKENPVTSNGDNQ